MLDKPEVKSAPAKVSAHTTSDYPYADFEEWLFALHYSELLAPIIKVADTWQFRRDLHRALRNWVVLNDGLLADSSRIASPDRTCVDATRVLSDMRRNAKCLLAHLENANEALSRAKADHDDSFTDKDQWLSVAFWLTGATYSADEPVIADMAASVAKVFDVVQVALQDVRHADDYPGLRELVRDLELAAQHAGWRLTAHRKNGGKGTLVTALDLLRSDLLASKLDIAHLAEQLPTKESHPVAWYERILGAVRRSVTDLPVIHNVPQNPG